MWIDTMLIYLGKPEGDDLNDQEEMDELLNFNEFM